MFEFLFYSGGGQMTKQTTECEILSPKFSLVTFENVDLQFYKGVAIESLSNIIVSSNYNYTL